MYLQGYNLDFCVIAKLLVIPDYIGLNAKQGNLQKFRDWSGCSKSSTLYHYHKRNNIKKTKL